MGQLFRKEVRIDNLPPLEMMRNRPAAVSVEEISNNAADTGLAVLFAGST